MINCDKRQKEIKTDRQGNQTEQHRCIEKKADTYLQIVDVPTCEGCPILAAKNSIPTCGGVERPAWASELLTVHTVDDGFDKPCPFRDRGRCRITGHEISPKICKACDQETADHMATLPEMAVGFANEVKVWIREGRPVRTSEEVAERLEICRGNPEKGIPRCQLYDSKKEACKKCGCAMNDSSWPLRNGILMKTKVCPMGLWS